MSVTSFDSFKNNLALIFSKNDGLPTPTESQAKALFELTNIMLEVNKSMNLTAITEETAVILKHYADSLTVAKYIPHGVKVLDVGCGAGFPTLPLAVFRPDLSILALDGTAKRIEYVKSTARALGLSGVEAVAARAEELGVKEGFRESFDVVTARAVASLPVLAELCLPFVKVGGSFVAMKAQQADEELSLAKNAIALCGGKIKNSVSVDLTADGNAFEHRNLIIVEKTAKTPPKYPRHYSKISKKPL